MAFISSSLPSSPATFSSVKRTHNNNNKNVILLSAMFVKCPKLINKNDTLFSHRRLKMTRVYCQENDPEKDRSTAWAMFHTDMTPQSLSATKYGNMILMEAMTIAIRNVMTAMFYRALLIRRTSLNKDWVKLEAEKLMSTEKGRGVFSEAIDLARKRDSGVGKWIFKGFIKETLANLRIVMRVYSFVWVVRELGITQTGILAVCLWLYFRYFDSM